MTPAPGNVSRIRRLADAVERSETYDQRYWWVGVDDEGPYEAASTPERAGVECGSPGCLSGHAFSIWGEADVRHAMTSWQALLAQHLGCSIDAAVELHKTQWDTDGLAGVLGISDVTVLAGASPTREQAAAVLRAWADAIEAEGSS